MAIAAMLSGVSIRFGDGPPVVVVADVAAEHDDGPRARIGDETLDGDGIERSLDHLSQPDLTHQVHSSRTAHQAQRMYNI